MLIIRNRLKYALTYREVIAILMQRHVLVDGKVRTDKTYPAGFMGKFLPSYYPGFMFILNDMCHSFLLGLPFLFLFLHDRVCVVVF